MVCVWFNTAVIGNVNILNFSFIPKLYYSLKITVARRRLIPKYFY